MVKERILVVEDAADISSLLKIYFISYGYEVFTAMRGKDALEICRKTPPDLALLDVNLPDMEGYDIGRELRAYPRTRHIPIVFLTARRERQDRLRGLGEVQAQYYIIKPFDIEEVHTIVRNLLEVARRKNVAHPVTNLPANEIINEHLQTLLSRTGWALALVHINGFEPFTVSYGEIVGEDVLKFTAMLLNEAVSDLETTEDFIGHSTVGPTFLLISVPERIKTICDQVMTRFDEEIGLHYNYYHRKQGYIEVVDDDGSTRRLLLMSLSIGVVTDQDGPFSDIHELIRTVEETQQYAAQQARRDILKSSICYGRSDKEITFYSNATFHTSVSISRSIEHIFQQPEHSVLSLCIESNPRHAWRLFQQMALVIPEKHTLISIGSNDSIAIVPTNLIDTNIEHMLDHFYTHPLVQELDAIVTYGHAHGPYPTATDLIEAVAMDHARQRQDQMIEHADEPAILSLIPKRRKIIRRYQELQHLFESYTQDARVSDSIHRHIRDTIDRLTAVVSHDLNSGFTSLKYALGETLSQQHTLPVHMHQTLETLAQYLIICTLWQRSISELGNGSVVHCQPLHLDTWLPDYLQVVACYLDHALTITISDVSTLPDLLADKQLLMVACLHLARAVRVAGATTLRVYVASDDSADYITLFFTDNGEANERSLALNPALPSSKRAELLWEYQNLTLMRHVLEIQSIDVRTRQINEEFQIQWNIPRSQVPNRKPFLTLQELEHLVATREEDVKQLLDQLRTLEKIIDANTSPKASYTLLTPFVNELERILEALLTYAGDLTSDRNVGFTQPIQRIARLLLYCYLLVRNLSLALQGSALPIEHVDINRQIRETIDLLEHKCQQLDIALELNSDVPRIGIASIEIKQVLMNLIKNAAEATQGSGTLHITTWHHHGKVVLRFKDTGCGIAPLHKDDIFQLNFSTKGKGSNSGIGLYTVQSIVHRAGGKIAVASATRNDKGKLVTWRRGFRRIDRFRWTDTGTIFQITFPAVGDD